jgi:anthranilate synthase/aminodeoxychorismate synthase-like glutamine amidotransferase
VRNILLIDNLDSFTFNLVEAFERLGSKVTTLRNSISPHDAFELAAAQNALIVLSPGPGRPESAGCCLELIRLAKGKLALLGICLGHQAIIVEAGGAVSQAQRPVHGKATAIDHDRSGPFAGLPTPLRVGRYHSLGAADPPKRFQVHAWAEGLAMAISDPKAKQSGLQFHPESLLTPLGDGILANILNNI